MYSLKWWAHTKIVEYTILSWKTAGALSTQCIHILFVLYMCWVLFFFIHILTETSKCLFSEKLTLCWAFERTKMKTRTKTNITVCCSLSPNLSDHPHCWDALTDATSALHNFIQLKFISWLRWLTYWHRILHMFHLAKTGSTGTRKLCCTVFAVNKIPCEQLQKIPWCCAVTLDFTRTLLSMITIAKRKEVWFWRWLHCIHFILWKFYEKLVDIKIFDSIFYTHRHSIRL